MKKIEGHSNYSLSTGGAIILTDQSAVVDYVNRKRKLNKKNEKVKNLENEVNDLKEMVKKLSDLIEKEIKND